MRGALMLAVLSAGLGAQDRPQLVWQGEVDGVSVLRVHGNRVDADERQGLPLQRQRFRFYERLPDSRVNVRMEVAEGRGHVRILEQPTLDNHYTLAVLIEDRQGGTSRYALEFYWDSGRGAWRWPESGRGNRGESLAWSGRVDGEAIVSCRLNTCEAKATRGGPIGRDRFRFSHPLPARELTVSLENPEGRGEVRLVEQPRESNDYTARVLIRDPQGGAGDYSFTLVWTPPALDDGRFQFSRRGLLWAGRVDGRVRVTVAGNIALAEVLAGQPVSAERATFFRPLPARESPNATVRPLRGRGRVEIVAFPSHRNHYELVFEIDDVQGGADNYEVEVSW